MGHVAVSDGERSALVDDAIKEAAVYTRELSGNPGHGEVTIRFNRTQEFVDVIPSAQYRRRPRAEEKDVALVK